jgi:hypothetical protein
MISLGSRSEPSFLAALGVVLEYECARDETYKHRHLLVDVALAVDERGLQFEGVTLSNFFTQPRHIKSILGHPRSHPTPSMPSVTEFEGCINVVSLLF